MKLLKIPIHRVKIRDWFATPFDLVVSIPEVPERYRAGFVEFLRTRHGGPQKNLLTTAIRISHITDDVALAGNLRMYLVEELGTPVSYLYKNGAPNAILIHEAAQKPRLVKPHKE